MHCLGWLVLAGVLGGGCGGGVPARIVGMDDRTVAVGELLELTDRPLARSASTADAARCPGHKP